jgi:phytoene desaturase
MIYLGLNKELPQLSYHSIIFAHDYAKNVEETTKTLILSDDPSVYVHYPNAHDATMAPEGHSTLYLLVPVPNLRAAIDWSSIHDDYVKKIIALVEQRTGVEITPHIQAMKTITPLDWKNDYGVYEGAVFNLSHKLSQMLMFRPHNRFTPAKGFYLVGGGTQPGSGLPTIYQSALITVEQVRKDLQ